MKTKQAVNFWTREQVMVPPLNVNWFHRVDYQNDGIIIGFFDYGSRTVETLTCGDIQFLTGFYCGNNHFTGVDLTYDIVGRDTVQNALPNMRDTFLRITKSK
jgi:hypothetical protein